MSNHAATYTEDGILCPHCGWEFFDEAINGFQEKEQFELICPECGTVLLVSWERQFWYNAEILEN